MNKIILSLLKLPRVSYLKCRGIQDSGRLGSAAFDHALDDDGDDEDEAGYGSYELK